VLYYELMAKTADPILNRFRDALDKVYGDRIERVVLFGSRARGDARPGSDYDLAVFLKELRGFGKEAGTIADIETDILFDTGAIINALPLQAGSHRERTGLMLELRRDGLDL
jgi:predicted nucleotidyltransferase